MSAGQRAEDEFYSLSASLMSLMSQI